MVEAALAQRAPESLHLAARLGVVRPGVQQADAQSRARSAQYLAAIGGAVVEEQCVGLSVQAQRSDQHSQHVLFALVACASSATT